jgi:hypothetical protein
MKRMAFSFLIVAGLAGSSIALAQSKATPWVHIRVEEPGKSSKVSVNLPLSVVQVALEAAPEHIVSEGRINLGRHHGHGDAEGHHACHHMTVADLRKLWREVSATGDGQFVTVEEKDEKVSIARKGNLVQIRAEEPGKNETVMVDVPVAVVDALLSGTGEELDVRAAIKQMESLRGDLVRVKERDSSVHIWVDEVN